MSMDRRLTAAIAAVVLAAGAVWFVVRDGDEPRRVATEYLNAWETSNYPAMGALVANPPADLAETYDRLIGRLNIGRQVIRLDRIEKDEGRTTAIFRARMRLRGLGVWSYTGRIPLTETEGGWRVRWSPAVINPRLRPGFRLGRIRSWPDRAPLLARDGHPITQDREVVLIGLHPKEVSDRDDVKEALSRQLDVQPRRVDAILDRDDVIPDWFYPLIEVRRPRYQRIASRLRVPGILAQESSARLAPSEEFGRHTLGRTGDITAELLQRFGEPYRSGDKIGRSGLELAFERRLAGAPSGEVRLIEEPSRKVAVLHRFRGLPGRSVRTTIDVTTQAALDEALDGVTKPAAAVVMDTRTGEIRAVASRPLDVSFNRALAGRYPPGSTFKIVTTDALLESGVTASRTVPCPRTINVGGKIFRNYDSLALGNIPFHRAFSASCNTAFVTLARKLSDEQLREAASNFGFGASYPLPISVAGGSFPEPRTEIERVAAAIGQGRVVASPVHMASVAAAVASGTWRRPLLVLPTPPDATRPLDRPVALALRSLMRRVVAEGTGRAARLPGEPVAGKTGTAEYGRGSLTHAWFVGFRGDLAFAVLVEGGGVGGRAAAPIASRFLRALD
jgi:cell division protein FtsI/penicillin-binding protein 2